MNAEPEITCQLVQKLIGEQFPQYRDLDVYPVERSGHDNRTFHLGKELAVRLPSGRGYASQVEKESRWLPYLQARLDFPISSPVALGRPSGDFPYPWSINKWLEGDTLLEDTLLDQEALAADLAGALGKLQAVDCRQGPRGGAHNCYRGCDLSVYHGEVLEAAERLRRVLPADRLLALWEEALGAPYRGEAVWVHGDVAPGNILVRNHRFYGLIDFGVLGTGDPSCDYAMAWTYFDFPGRSRFLRGLDAGLVLRARGWALWKALITYEDANSASRENARRTVDVLLGDSAADLPLREQPLRSSLIRLSKK